MSERRASYDPTVATGGFSACSERSPARAALDAAMTEKDLLAFVVDTARAYGWLIYHTHDSRRSEAGFPDLVMTKQGRLLFVELKSERGRVSAAQWKWLRALRDVELALRGTASGIVGVAIWGPSDMGLIISTLAQSGTPG